ncbi:twin-arginine translocase subunit TatC [Candidatus Bathyarchaeota archaeon]|nr:twin-arginine translocase subunit TatC [Candidatus Bathyarchaeota archaeon]MBS7630861.1 twin-arginine translocase subunit TatC [Candidatus Bathyarchaeota archaeon]
MSVESELPIWDHLDELAKRLRRILFSVMISTIIIVSIPSDFSQIIRLDFKDYRPLISLVITSIEDHFLPQGVTLIALNWLDTFTVYIVVGVVMGTLISLPLIAFELYKFINPALYSHERRMVLSFTLAFSALFSIGALYAYFILLPITFNVLLRFVYGTGVSPLFSILDFFNLVAFSILGSGLFYTLPLIVFILVRINLLEVETLRENRRKVFIGLVVMTAIITPDPTPLSMLLMSIPFYLLYETTIQVIGRIVKNKKREEIIAEGLKASKRLLAIEKEIQF